MTARPIMEERDEAWLATLRAIPGYPWLPCPLCNNGEGCVHPAPQRARAAVPGLQLPIYIGGEGNYRTDCPKKKATP